MKMFLYWKDFCYTNGKDTVPDQSGKIQSCVTKIKFYLVGIHFPLLILLWDLDFFLQLKKIQISI